MRVFAFSVLFLLLGLISFFSFSSKKREVKIYLAGPEVFLPNPIEKGNWKREVIERFNRTVLKGDDFRFMALYPMDPIIKDFKLDPQTAMRIFYNNIDLMKEADIVIANMTRFRGPSMDVGTAFEMGFVYALNKPVLGYYSVQETYCTSDQKASDFDCTSFDSDKSTLYVDKVKNFAKGYFMGSGEFEGRDRYTHLVEDFKLGDNLMMLGAVRGHSGKSKGYSVADSFWKALEEAAEISRRVE